MESKLSHIGIWSCNLEQSRAFYQKYFNGKSTEKYTNSAKGFSSYFISFSNGVAVEVMQRTDITVPRPEYNHIGIAHFAFTIGSEEQVNRLTEQLRLDGYTINSEPRPTGDGFYESSILDPDGNIIELVS